MTITLLEILEIIIISVVGLCLGSFCTAITFRELNDLSWGVSSKNKNNKSQNISPHRSCCPSCHHPLNALDLIPLISWCVVKGKCRYCQHAIGWIYPLTELTAMMAALLTYIAMGFTLSAFIVLALIPFLLALTIIDLKEMILPNRLVLIVGLIGLLFNVVEQLHLGVGLIGILPYLAAGLLFGGVAWLIGAITSWALKKEALGMGDVKFFIAAGIWLGPLDLPDFCLFSGLLGIIMGALWRWANGSNLFPFGPALIVSLFCLVLLDFSIIDFFLTH